MPTFQTRCSKPWPADGRPAGGSRGGSGSQSPPQAQLCSTGRIDPAGSGASLRRRGALVLPGMSRSAARCGQCHPRWPAIVNACAPPPASGSYPRALELRHRRRVEPGRAAVQARPTGSNRHLRIHHLPSSCLVAIRKPNAFDCRSSFSVEMCGCRAPGCGFQSGSVLPLKRCPYDRFHECGLHAPSERPSHRPTALSPLGTP